mgnify:CR=1 FL=1
MWRIALAAVVALSLPFAPLATGSAAATQCRLAALQARGARADCRAHCAVSGPARGADLQGIYVSARGYPGGAIRKSQSRPEGRCPERSAQKTTNGTIASKLWLAFPRSSSGWTVSSSGCSSSAKPSSRSKRTLWTPSSVCGRKRSNRPESYWYYCSSAGAYYPTVPTCPEPWIKVPPRCASRCASVRWFIYASGTTTFQCSGPGCGHLDS